MTGTTMASSQSRYSGGVIHFTPSSVLQDLQHAMRRAGHNPTDVEVHDLINKIDNG